MQNKLLLLLFLVKTNKSRWSLVTICLVAICRAGLRSSTAVIGIGLVAILPMR